MRLVVDLAEKEEVFIEVSANEAASLQRTETQGKDAAWQADNRLFDDAYELGEIAALIAKRSRRQRPDKRWIAGVPARIVPR